MLLVNNQYSVKYPLLISYQPIL